VASKPEKVEVIRLDRSIERPSITLGGQLSVIDRHPDGGVTVLKDGKEILHLEYAGVKGLELSKRIYSRGSSVNAYTFFTSPDKSRTLLVTANDDNRLHLYSASPDTTNSNLNFDPDCREPEPHVSSVPAKSDYCVLHPEHTKCLYSTPNLRCNIINRILSTANKDKLVEKINEHRRSIATGSLVGVPAASNMREVTWDKELARLAELWASQCVSNIETNRKVLLGGVEVPFSQIIYKFDMPAHQDQELSMEDVVKVVEFWFNSHKDTTNLQTLIGKYEIGTDDNVDVGYFTQAAWAKSYKMGCGWTLYKEKDDSRMSIVVCNFVEEGNVKDQAVYKIGTACAGCDSGFACENSLCTKA